MATLLCRSTMIITNAAEFLPDVFSFLMLLFPQLEGLDIRAGLAKDPAFKILRSLPNRERLHFRRKRSNIFIGRYKPNGKDMSARAKLPKHLIDRQGIRSKQDDPQALLQRHRDGFHDHTRLTCAGTAFN
jgi:hypothetical protein